MEQTLTSIRIMIYHFIEKLDKLIIVRNNTKYKVCNKLWIEVIDLKSLITKPYYKQDIKTLIDQYNKNIIIDDKLTRDSRFSLYRICDSLEKIIKEFGLRKGKYALENNLSKSVITELRNESIDIYDKIIDYLTEDYDKLVTKEFVQKMNRNIDAM